MDVVRRNYDKFQQKQANEAKLGAYYTDPEHCAWLGKLFSFSKEEETCVLEPSAGNGMAVKLVTQAQDNPLVRIFAVEIDQQVAEEHLEKDTCFESVLKADFKSDVVITNNVFSFCFGNPPYMDELNFDRSYGAKTERSEKVFLEKVTGYLKPGGILCWVIPHRVFVENTYMSFWMSRYETLGVYKFHDKEFAKWGQVAVIGRKRGTKVGIYTDDRAAMQERCKLELLSYVPFEELPEEKKIVVPPSPTKAILNFRTKVFDVAAARKWVDEHPSCIANLNQAIASRTGVKPHDDTCYYKPPKKLSNQNLALLTACGVGSGFAGNVEDGTLHLQRGSVTQTIEKSLSVPVAGSKSGVLTEKKRSVTNIVLIESNGTITDLVKHDDGKEEVFCGESDDDY